MYNMEDSVDSQLKHLWLNNIEGVSPLAIMRLKKYYGNVWNIYDAGENSLKNVVSDNLVKKIMDSKKGTRIQEMYHRLLEKNITLLYPEKTIYPKKLKQIYCPPQLLYVKGRIKNIIDEYNRTIGIVGSRNPSIYGKEVCRYFGENLSKYGFNIVSGMANGIDGISHRAALDNNGYTVAVLGSGINVVYPRSNIEIYSKIEEEGAVISEYGLDIKPNPWQFPERNRIISGLSDGVLVIEAREKSGSLITVDHAIEQGRTVYCVPGRIMDKNCEGTNGLIRDGAICVTKPEDIVEEMVGSREFNKKQIDNNLKSTDNTTQLSEVEKKILECLSLEPTYIDDIIQRTKVGVTKTISYLYMLEEKRLIKQIMQGYYIRHI